MSNIPKHEEAKPCGVSWCRNSAYPGSEYCQFHEAVNPFDDTPVSQQTADLIEDMEHQDE